MGVDYQQYSRAQAEVIVDTVGFVVGSSVHLDLGGETIPELGQLDDHLARATSHSDWVSRLLVRCLRLGRLETRSARRLPPTDRGLGLRCPHAGFLCDGLLRLSDASPWRSWRLGIAAAVLATVMLSAIPTTASRRAQDHRVVADYCGYGAQSQHDLEGCIAHVSVDYVLRHRTPAARFAQGKTDVRGYRSGPACLQIVHLRNLPILVQPAHEAPWA